MNPYPSALETSSEFGIEPLLAVKMVQLAQVVAAWGLSEALGSLVSKRRVILVGIFARSAACTSQLRRAIDRTDSMFIAWAFTWMQRSSF